MSDHHGEVDQRRPPAFGQPLYDLRVRQSVIRVWARALKPAQTVLLNKIIDVTVGFQREKFTTSLEALVTGRNSDGDLRHTPLSISLRSAQRHLPELCRLGLVHAYRKPWGYEFHLNHDLILHPPLKEDGSALLLPPAREENRDRVAYAFDAPQGSRYSVDELTAAWMAALKPQAKRKRAAWWASQRQALEQLASSWQAEREGSDLDVPLLDFIKWVGREWAGAVAESVEMRGISLPPLPDAKCLVKHPDSFQMCYWYSVRSGRSWSARVQRYYKDLRLQGLDQREALGEAWQEAGGEIAQARKVAGRP